MSDDGLYDKNGCVSDAVSPFIAYSRSNQQPRRIKRDIKQLSASFTRHLHFSRQPNLATKQEQKMATTAASSLFTNEAELGQQCLDFLNASRSAFAAVATARHRLVEAGFVGISEKDTWNGSLKPGGKYFFTRNQSTIVAFVVGGQFDAQKGQSGFTVAAAHTDSPCLKVKPISNVNKNGTVQVGVEVYGGGLWHTWFDRDLGLSGRVLVRENGKIVSKLVSIHRPLLRIPSLAIHLDRSVSEAFKFNHEEQLLPILATQIKAELEKPAAEPSSPTATMKNHPSLLLQILATELKVEVEAIEFFELSLCDAQDGVVGGALNEFIWSGRLDNLLMSFVCLESVLKIANDAVAVAKQPNTVMAVLFDNEEVGSATSMGADSTVLEDTISRIAHAIGTNASSDLMSRVLRRSFLLSCDMAHALHPNYPQKHESNHKPQFHQGLVIKYNANQRYATTAESSVIVQEVGRRYGIPLQSFVTRNDSPCGSTIGPILASRIGLRCADVGVPQLSMHSIREMAAVGDVQHACRLVYYLLSDFSEIDSTIVTDADL
jgi:aspartyl aminopeptidase